MMKNVIISILMIVGLLLALCLLVAITQTFRHKTKDGYIVKFNNGFKKEKHVEMCDSFSKAYWRYVARNILDVISIVAVFNWE